MTDSRAALEEAAEKFWQEKHARSKGNIVPITSALADFAEQESSSLKLLLRAMIKGKADVNRGDVPQRFVHVYFLDGGWRHFPVELDSSGIPVLTEEILKALEAAK